MSSHEQEQRRVIAYMPTGSPWRETVNQSTSVPPSSRPEALPGWYPVTYASASTDQRPASGGVIPSGLSPSLRMLTAHGVASVCEGGDFIPSSSARTARYTESHTADPPDSVIPDEPRDAVSSRYRPAGTPRHRDILPSWRLRHARRLDARQSTADDLKLRASIRPSVLAVFNMAATDWSTKALGMCHALAVQLGSSAAATEAILPYAESGTKDFQWQTPFAKDMAIMLAELIDAHADELGFAGIPDWVAAGAQIGLNAVLY